MQYIAAFFLLPSTIVLLSYISTMLAGDPGLLLLEIENGIVNVAFLIVFFISSLTGWLAVIFSVPFRDGDRITLVGKGVLMGLAIWPFVFVALYFEGRVALAACLLMGWLGLSVPLLPAMSKAWSRRVPILGLLAGALTMPVLINPAIWTGSKWAPVPEANWGVYYPDYAMEEGERFVAHYQDHEKRFNKPARIIISKTSMFMVNVLGRPLSNTFNHCGPKDNFHVFASGFVDGCDSDKADISGNMLEIEFYEQGKLRCVNCREFGKPRHWMLIESLETFYDSPSSG